MTKKPLTPDDIRNGERGLIVMPIELLSRELQARVQLNPDTIAEYAEQMQAKDESGFSVQFPPIDVIFDVETGVFYVVDGGHRIEAKLRNGCTEILCAIWSLRSTRETAIEAAAKANRAHGLPRTQADKEKAVRMLFSLEFYRTASDRFVAEHAGVSHPFVGRIRRELEILPVEDEPEVEEPDHDQLETLPVEKTAPAPVAKPEKRKGRDGKARRVPVAKQVMVPAEPEPADMDMSLDDRLLDLLANGKWRDHRELSDEFRGYVPKEAALALAPVEGDGRWQMFRDVLALLIEEGKIEKRIVGDDYEYRLAPVQVVIVEDRTKPKTRDHSAPDLFERETQLGREVARLAQYWPKDEKCELILALESIISEIEDGSIELGLAKPDKQLAGVKS